MQFTGKYQPSNNTENLTYIRDKRIVEDGNNEAIVQHGEKVQDHQDHLEFDRKIHEEERRIEHAGKHGTDERDRD